MDERPTARVLAGYTSLAAFAYVVLFLNLRHVHESFYEPLGVTPDELGLNYTNTVQRAASGLLVGLGVPLLAFVIVVQGLLVLYLYVELLKSPKTGRLGSMDKLALSIRFSSRNAKLDGSSAGLVQRNYRERTASARTVAAWARLLGAGAIAVFLFWGIGTDARLASQSLACGCQIRLSDSGNVGSPSFSSLGLRADPVSVIWLSDEASGQLSLTKNGGLLYLGESSGVVVLYDHVDEVTLRVPRSLVALEFGSSGLSQAGTQRVLEAYEASWKAHSAAFAIGDPNHPDLPKHLARGDLTNTRRVISDLAEEGLGLLDAITVNSRVSSTASLSAVIEDCQLWETQSVDLVTGAPTTGVTTQQRGVRATMERVDGAWKRTSISDDDSLCEGYESATDDQATLDIPISVDSNG